MKRNKPQVYNRIELVNRDVERIKISILNVLDKSILFWFTNMQSAIATGDVHGRLTASTLVAALEHIKSELQQIESVHNGSDSN